jgi:TetR/AcrR family transcriptional regulator, regulator of cefoperazone and chloramphenicol sensitivity
MDRTQIPDWCRALLEPEDEHGKRRQSLLRAAFDVIAEAGFEGLRTRAVTARAGVNVATLHYYFPTKQDLVEGLAQFLSAKFVVLHGPEPALSGYAALDRLRQEFSDARFYFAHEPQMLIVMQEFTMRGRRDPAVQKIVDEMNFHWRHGLEEIVRTGVSESVFRQDVEPEAMLSTVMSILTGIAVVGGDRIGEIERVTEAWILSDKVKKELEERRV